MRTTLLLLRISCILSIIGSIIVMAACRFPETMRKKKGRQLIFWLSVSDFWTSVVYFLSTFEHSDQNTSTCKTLALLGIFFPVASFFWTDFVAWHIYITIAERKIKTDAEWENIMKIFHVIAWGFSGLCILLIGVFDHAGRESDTSNTGGWCWVVAQDHTIIYWELLGGKFVEWTSCFIWLPVMYFLTIRTLYELERSGSVALANSLRRNNPTSGVAANAASTVRVTSSSSGQNSDDQNNLFGSRKFQIFYLKMALVPIIFFLIRLWGSLRIFLYLSNNSTSESIADSYLYYLQAIFDPSQGFFNAIIFVFLSSKDRANLTVFLTTPYLVHQFFSGCRGLCGYGNLQESSSGNGGGLLDQAGVGGINGTSRRNPDWAVTNPLSNRRFAVQEDTIVELSSHMPSGESEMTGYCDNSRESEESSRAQTISRITRDSFSIPPLDDEC